MELTAAADFTSTLLLTYFLISAFNFLERLVSEITIYVTSGMLNSQKSSEVLADETSVKMLVLIDSQCELRLTRSHLLQQHSSGAEHAVRSAVADRGLPLCPALQCHDSDWTSQV